MLVPQAACVLGGAIAYRFTELVKIQSNPGTYPCLKHGRGSLQRTVSETTTGRHVAKQDWR